MNDLSAIQSLVLLGTYASGIATMTLFFTRRTSVWLFILPWAAILLATAWFVISKDYFSQHSVQLDVPIRIDLVFFPLMMVFSFVAGTMRIYNWNQSRKQQ